MLTVPWVVVVVIVAWDRRVLNAGLLVGKGRFIQVPFLNFGRERCVLRTRFEKVTVVFRVILVLTQAFRVREAHRPITKPFRALQSPVYPGAGFNVSGPFEGFVILR